MVARIHQPARQPIGQQNCRRPDSVIVALHVPVTGAERDAALCHGEIQKAPAPRWKRGPLEATTGRCSACKGVLCGGLAEAGLGALGRRAGGFAFAGQRSEEHTSELQSLMRISYAVFCLKKKNKT